EALSCSVPVLIGNATPWRNLESDAVGWDLPLDDPGAFALAIDRFATMDETARTRLRVGARARAERWVKESDAVGKHRIMFETVLAKERSGVAGRDRNDHISSRSWALRMLSPRGVEIWRPADASRQGRQTGSGRPSIRVTDLDSVDLTAAEGP